jgi:MFS family permease
MFRELLFAIRTSNAYWRSASFSEIAELYASRFLRIIAQNLVDVFIVVYLYQQGYGLLLICVVLGLHFLHRALWGYLSAYIIAWIGPKSTLLLSNITAVPALVSLALIGTYGFTTVIAFFIFEGISGTLLGVATDVQFSSIKHEQKAGRELGWLYIAEKIGAALAPAIGGFVAYRFGPQSIMWVASLMMVAAALPLLLSPENTLRRQRVTYHGFDWRTLGSQMVAPAIRGADGLISGGLWSVFIAITIFNTASNEIYAQIGVFFSIAFGASILISWMYGVLIDSKKGLQLLRTGILLDVSIHAMRPFITTPIAVGMTNVANEAATSAYSMPAFRAQYDVTDQLPGYRAVYFSISMITYCVGAAVLAFISAGLIWWLGEVNGLKATFFVMAALAPFMMIHGFKTLRAPR